MGDVDPVGTVKAALAPAHHAMVLGETLAHLLCIDATCGCGAPHAMSTKEGP